MTIPPGGRTWADGTVGVTVREGIATLLLDRPAKRNAMTAAMWRAIPEAVAAIAADDGVRAVLMRGAGEAAFCAGADIGEFPDVYATAEATRAYSDAVRAAQNDLAWLPKPVVAVVFGVCVGGGCGLALACDLRFAAAGARFAIPPAKLGAAYAFADVKQLTDLVGPARAKDILFTGRLVPAAEAHAIGLVDRVVPEEALLAAAEAYAAELAGLSSVSIATTKATVQAIRDGVDEETGELRAMFDATFAAEDFREGYNAFLEKRKPVFR
ncbi:enoyl-CoA hydratase-related protein [Acuticoccus sediminis]|uniref:enoyl-CoA hydratase-related protein n=1 Tax=Acuticoccus sediminis TaxID=2184697 RepID=UPI001CFCB6CC|nr:enoyl-CoA hydratase-related protein [Acuticoccus sediminis]